MTSLLLNMIALFVIGFIQDIVGAYYLRLVTEERFIVATIVSFVHSILGWAIWVYFMYQFQHAETLTGVQAVVHSIGSAAGTFFGLRKPGQGCKLSKT